MSASDFWLREELYARNFKIQREISHFDIIVLIVLIKNYDNIRNETFRKIKICLLCLCSINMKQDF